MSDQRPDLTKKRASEPRPAPAAGRDPVDTPPRATSSSSSRPAPKVMRQFRLSLAEDELLVQLQQHRGDAKLIDTQRWLLSLVPGLLSGRYDIDPTEEQR